MLGLSSKGMNATTEGPCLVGSSREVCSSVPFTRLQGIEQEINHLISRLAKLQEAKKLLTDNPSLEELYNKLSAY